MYSEMEREWSNERVLKLIEMYRERPNLWDWKNKDYRDRNRRHDSIMDIAVFFAVSKEEIERKMKNLVSHLSREMKKENENVKSRPGADGVYKSKWFAFKSMQFLKCKNKPRRTAAPAGKIIDSSEKGITIIPESDSQVVDKPKKTSEEAASEKTKRFLSPKRTATRKRKCDDQVKEAYDIMKEMCARRSIADEYSLFGEQIAIKIRQLPTHHAKIMVQHIINTTLFEAEMGKYNEPAKSHNSSRPLHPVHPTPSTSAIHSSSVPSTSSTSQSQPTTPNEQSAFPCPESYTCTSKQITLTAPFAPPYCTSSSSNSTPTSPEAE